MNAYYETTYRADYKGQAAPPLRKIVRGFLGASDRRRMLRGLLEAPHEGAPYDSPRGTPHGAPEESSRGTPHGAPDESSRRAPLYGVPPRMLDVGCGAGELVYLMRRDGVDA